MDRILAVERLGKALHRAPFAHPATVRGRVCGRIGPLVLVSRLCEQVAEHEPDPFALGARVTSEPQAVPPELGPRFRQRSSRTRPLLSHAKRAALVWRFAAKRWSIWSHDRPFQRHASTKQSSGAAAPPRSSAGTAPGPISAHYRRGSRRYRRPGPPLPAAASAGGGDRRGSETARRRTGCRWGSPQPATGAATGSTRTGRRYRSQVAATGDR